MYNMLIVDDELHAVKGISEGISWSEMQIGRIYEAGDAEEAKYWFSSERIDVVISDIEMPGDNGLDLQQWIREHSPQTKTIFLTAHADFSYAQKAVKVGSFDYLVKPIDHNRLKEIVRQALTVVQSEHDQNDSAKTYRTCYEYWLNQLPVLVEKFWQDVVADKSKLSRERLERAAEMYSIPLGAQSRILPILISVEKMRDDLSVRDEEIMEYALRKSAAEVILSGAKGCVFQDRSGTNLLFIYVNDGDDADLREIGRRCRSYVAACNQYFYTHLSCYMGEAVPAADIALAVNDLLNRECHNVSKTNQVLYLRETEESVGTLQPLPCFNNWSDLIYLGKIDELLSQIEEALDQMMNKPIRPETLEAFYYGLLHVLYQTAHKKGLSVRDFYSFQQLQDKSATRSLFHLRNWAFKLVTLTGARFTRHHESSAIIVKVREYILEHLQEDLNREDIAAFVYLNPAYLSRLFRKETGQSLTEFILSSRVEKAKELLETSSDKIGSVAESTGFGHLSHFAKMFKRLTGVTPQEYRKKLSRKC